MYNITDMASRWTKNRFVKKQVDDHMLGIKTYHEGGLTPTDASGRIIHDSRVYRRKESRS